VGQIYDYVSTKRRHRWVDNIKMYLGGTRWGGIKWINLALGRNHLTFRLHKTLGSPRATAQLAASREGLSSLCDVN
jgi:hypothetical protein